MNGEGFNPFDLARTEDAAVFHVMPLRKRLSGPETHAERMARTDRQLEEERRRHALHDRLTTAQLDWIHVNAAYEAQRNIAASAVLEIHHPVLRNSEVVCAGCFSLDEHGDFNDTWGCDTFIALKELAF